MSVLQTCLTFVWRLPCNFTMDYIASSDKCLTFHYRISQTLSLVHIMVCCMFCPCSEPSNAGLSINWTVRNINFNKIWNKITTFLSRMCIWKYWKYRLQSGILCRPQCVDIMAAWFKIIGLGYHVYQFTTVRRGLLCTGGIYHNGNRHFDSFGFDIVPQH